MAAREQTARRLLDVLQPSAANNAAAGAASDAICDGRGRNMQAGTLKPSKINAPRRRIPGNAAISPAEPAGAIGKSKHHRAAHAGRPFFTGFVTGISSRGRAHGSSPTAGRSERQRERPLDAPTAPGTPLLAPRRGDDPVKDFQQKPAHGGAGAATGASQRDRGRIGGFHLKDGERLGLQGKTV
jgi:hypothetical protein